MQLERGFKPGAGGLYVEVMPSSYRSSIAGYALGLPLSDDLSYSLIEELGESTPRAGSRGVTQRKSRIGPSCYFFRKDDTRKMEGTTRFPV